MTDDVDYSSVRTPSVRLDGRVALVTGASRGLGAAAAIALGDAGAEVVLIARTAADLTRVSDRINSAGGKARHIVCDVCDSDGLEHHIGGLARLDIVVNNAGTSHPQPFIAVDEEVLDRLIALNLKAVFRVGQLAARKMLEAPDRREFGGSIINISSVFGHVASVNRSVYCMTKHGVEGLNKAMAIELALSGIRVNSLAPSYIDTPLVRSVINTDEKMASVLDRIPTRQLGTVEDVMAAILFLASPASRMMTGSCLVMDGGMTAQ